MRGDWAGGLRIVAAFWAGISVSVEVTQEVGIVGRVSIRTPF